MPTLETRYLLLATKGKCGHSECRSAPDAARLVVVRRHDSGLAVADNLVVRCEQHMSDTVDTTESVLESPSVAPPLGHEEPPAPVASPGPVDDAPEAAALAETFAGYALERRLTSGGMAEAFLAVAVESGEEVFLKRVVSGSVEAAALEREASIYSRLELRSCQHIMSVVELIREAPYVALVCERAEMDLEQFVQARGGALATDAAKDVIREVVEGLAELHEFEVIHRDLKPSNVVLRGGHWLLTDFGISKTASQVSPQTFRLRGTSGYAAPEQLLTGVEARASADVYALGKLIVFLLTGATDIDALQFRQWRRLVRDCTAEDPDERCKLEDVVSRLDEIDE